MASGIYIIHNEKNGKVYIGQSQDIRFRWGEHKRSLKADNHPNRHLQNAWNKYGENSFNFRVLEYCAVDQLDIREQHFLDIYAPKGMCYNTALIIKKANRQNADDSELIPIYMRGDKEFVAVLKAQAAKYNLRLADYLRKALDYKMAEDEAIYFASRNPNR